MHLEASGAEGEKADAMGNVEYLRLDAVTCGRDGKENQDEAMVDDFTGKKSLGKCAGDTDEVVRHVDEEVF